MREHERPMAYGATGPASHITGAQFVDAVRETIPEAFSDIDGPIGENGEA